MARRIVTGSAPGVERLSTANLSTAGTEVNTYGTTGSVVPTTAWKKFVASRTSTGPDTSGSTNRFFAVNALACDSWAVATS